MELLRSAFRSILLDSPPLLVASDANILAGLVDGTLLVARVGSTTAHSMNRAIESLSPDSILGIVANGI
jgi:receptor protein-tyrosine kinase